MRQAMKEETPPTKPVTPTVRIDPTPLGRPDSGVFEMSIRIDDAATSTVIVHTSPKKFGFQNE